MASTTTPTRLNDVYQHIQKNYGRQASWIANCIYTSCKDRKYMLASLLVILESGAEVSSAPFTLGEVGFLIDGYYFPARVLCNVGESWDRDDTKRIADIYRGE